MKTFKLLSLTAALVVISISSMQAGSWFKRDKAADTTKAAEASTAGVAGVSEATKPATTSATEAAGTTSTTGSATGAATPAPEVKK